MRLWDYILVLISRRKTIPIYGKGCRVFKVPCIIKRKGKLNLKFRIQNARNYGSMFPKYSKKHNPNLYSILRCIWSQNDTCKKRPQLVNLFTWEMYGCVLSSPAIDVLNHQAIRSHDVDWKFIVLDQFHYRKFRWQGPWLAYIIINWNTCWCLSYAMIAQWQRRNPEEYW